MRWLVRESRLPSVSGCEELKPTARYRNLEGETVDRYNQPQQRHLESVWIKKEHKPHRFSHTVP